MTKKIYLVFALCAIFNLASGQDNTISIDVDAGSSTFIYPVGSKLPLEADFSKTVTIKFIGTTLPTNYKVTKIDATISDPVVRADTKIYDFTVTDKKAKQIKVLVHGDGVSHDLEIPINNSYKESNTGNIGYNYFFNNFPNFKDINKRYDRKENKAYFYFNEKGMLLGPAPVNVDADDYLIIYMAVPKLQSSSFSIQVDGDYNASDLLIRPYEPIAAGAAQGTGLTTSDYTYITQTFGPFTSDKATIRFFNGENELTNHLDVRINKLYNVAIGASFISTNLEKPSFDIFPIAGTTNNTINTINNGSRTLATFNVIYYWKPTIDWVSGKLKGKSNITRGRDILKEATFWERLNPTFGVAINSEWRENFFFGGNFEFARGGSISAGWHYGKVQKLADSNFKLGTDVYTGTKEDIKLTDTWQTGFFFGITLDTRIFNKILSRN